MQLIDQIHQSFEENRYTLGVFIYQSKAFNTVDHNILLKKLELYAIDGTDNKWLQII